MKEIHDQKIEGQPLVVLGMHRSGTSALTRLLNLLGADLGNDLLPINSSNERGYWEHSELVGLNDKILNDLYYSWDETYLLQNVFWYNRRVESHCEQIKEVLKREFTKSKLWLIKDPRISVLLPIWLKIFNELEVRPRFIFIMRHPAEVVPSLTKRERMSDEKAYLLWYHYNVMAERFSRDFDRVFISYDDLLKDWRAVADRISSGLSIDWPCKAKSVENEIDQFLSADLRHFSANNQSNFPCPKIIVDLYNELEEASRQKEEHHFSLSPSLQSHIDDFDKFNIVLLKQHTRVDRAKLSFNKQERKEFEEVQARLIAEQAMLTNLKKTQENEIQALRMTISAIYQSRSWRIMHPVRFIFCFLKKIAKRLNRERNAC